MLHRVLAAAAGLALSLAASGAVASDKVFFESVAGVWSGPGKIVAGKYEGTEFNCTLTGIPSSGTEAGVVMDGTCRVGVFGQEMSATIRQVGESYQGQFLDGAAGEGLDIVSGRVEPGRVIMAITRKQLEGVMVATLTGAHSMNITVSVQVGETLIPVIGMSLERDIDSVAVGSIR